MPARIIYIICLLSTHSSNFNANVREFGEFDLHKQLVQLLQCSVQLLLSYMCLSVGYDTVKYVKYR